MDSFSSRQKNWTSSNFDKNSLLAEVMKLHPNLLSEYINEKKKPGLDKLKRLAELGCDINWLLTGEKNSSIIKEPQEENSAESVVVKKDHFDKLSDLVESLSKRVEDLEKSR